MVQVFILVWLIGETLNHDLSCLKVSNKKKGGPKVKVDDRNA